jgi:hypothetical protein
MGEGTQNLLCAYLAIAVFAVLAANTLLGAWGLDGAVAQDRWLGGRGRRTGLGGTIVRMHIRARHMLLSGTGGGPARPDGPRVYLRPTSRVPSGRSRHVTALAPARAAWMPLWTVEQYR